MQLVPGRPNVELRRDREGQPTVVLSFPYDRVLVDMARSIPHRRFDWDTREWSAPATDWAALKVLEMLDRYPELEATGEVGTWLTGVTARWIGQVSTARHDGRGWWALSTLAGPIPEELVGDGIEHDGRLLVELTPRPRRSCAPSRRRAWTPARIAAWRSSSTAACPRRRDWRGFAASTASACAWRCCGIPTSDRRSSS